MDGPDSVLALGGPHLLKSEGRQDNSSSPYRVGATTLISIVDGANAVSSFFMARAT